MPELPDITIYVEALERRIVGERLEGVRIQSPFLLRTFDPPLESVNGKTVREVRRLGKRIVLGLDDEFWLVLHLMIAGRLHWKEPEAKLATKAALAVFKFSNGTLLLTEAGTKRRASLYLIRGEDGLREHDPGGLEPIPATLDEFHSVLRKQNHTLKRALADPHLFSGIGNAYSDEILHRARLSPLALSQKLTGRRSGTTLHSHACRSARMDRASPGRDGRRLAREGDRVSSWDGRARAVWQALSGLWCAGAADPLCRQRDQLLPRMPDGRPDPGRPLAVAIAQG